MTVSTTTSRVSYSGNGSTVTFTVPFYFIYSTDLKVYKTSSANVQTLLVEGTDYTVTGAGVISGGSITCTTAPSSDYTIIIYRDPATTQLVDYQANDPFPAETHERALDKLTMLAQRLNDVNNRSIHLSDGDASNASTELSSPLANYLIGWNSTGDALINYDPGTLATIVAYGTAHADIFSGTGSQTTFTLMHDPGALNNLDVSISGVTQRPGTDYTWTTGTTVTFTTAPPLGTNNILVRYMQGLPQGTSDAASALYTPAGTGAVATTVQAKLRETVSVKDFGAVGDGVVDDTAAIQAAIAAADSIYFPFGTYVVSSTIQIEKAIQIDGAPGVAIQAKTGFTGINVTKDAAPYTLKAIFAIFTGSTINTTSGTRIGESTTPISISNIQLLGNNNAVDYCLYIERCPGAKIFGVQTYSGVNGIFFGPYCWGLQCINFRIFGASNIALNMGIGSNGILLSNFEIWGGATVTSSVGIKSDGDNYGVSIIGGYIEKIDTGVYIVGNSGPHLISGIDIELATQHAVRTNCSPNQVYGPVTIEECFLQSNDAMIYNASAQIIARGNSFRASATWTGQHFYSTTTDAVFETSDNRYMDFAGFNISPVFTGSRSLTSTQTTSRLLSITNKRDTETSGAYDSNYGVYNYSSVDEPDIISGSLEFQNSRQGNPGAVYSSRWKLVANETWLNGTTPEIKYTSGVYLSSLGGVKSFTPIADNTHSLGNSTYRWSVVYAGTGTINTSDERAKQDIADLNDAEKRVAVALKGMVKKFRFKDAVAAKGDDARIHVGVIAQEVVAAFEAEGLDATKYGLLCYDEWEATDDTPAGNRYGVRYEELLAFILAAI